MSHDILKGNWKILKGKLQQQWSKLTEDDIGLVEGNHEELEGLLQKKYGYQKEQAKREINTFLEKNHFNE